MEPRQEDQARSLGESCRLTQLCEIVAGVAPDLSSQKFGFVNLVDLIRRHDDAIEAAIAEAYG